MLLALKREQPLTAKELADEFAVSSTAIRRHLKELEVEGLVHYEREQRGTGAPTYTYRLSDRGEALFPTQYSQALEDALSYIAKSGGRDAVRAMFAERFRGHAERMRAELQDAPLEDKLQAVVEMLSQQGFMAAWTVEGNQVRLAEHHCAVRAVAERFPEICAAEADFLRDVLQSDVHRDSYIPDGCNACQYSISLGTTNQAPNPEVS
jgi:DeoR family suf operon transcriptional repressor